MGDFLSNLHATVGGVRPMSGLATLAVLFVAFLHLAFFVLESFLWDKPQGRKIFGLSREKAMATLELARNQGVYNAFLGAGLFWSVQIALAKGIGYIEFSRSLANFFLACVVIAGVVGAWTVNRRIFWVQAAPALVAMILIKLSR